MQLYSGEELLLTGDGDKGYNTMAVNLAPRCSCGGNVRPVGKGRDDLVFFGDKTTVVIATLCESCDNPGVINIDMKF